MNNSKSNRETLLLSRRMKIMQKLFSRLLIVCIVLGISFAILFITCLYLTFTKKVMLTRSIKCDSNGDINTGIKITDIDFNNTYTISEDDFKLLKRDKYLNRFAAAIVTDFARSRQSVSFYDVKNLIIAAEKYVKLYFPTGPFTKFDLLAIAKYESDFDLRCIGKAGEHGAFQILDWKDALQQIGKSRADIFDPYINTECGCLVLKEKYSHTKDFKMAIIAYNGICKLEDGTISEVYYERFLKAKQYILSIDKKVL